MGKRWKEETDLVAQDKGGEHLVDLHEGDGTADAAAGAGAEAHVAAIHGGAAVAEGGVGLAGGGQPALRPEFSRIGIEYWIV